MDFPFLVQRISIMAIPLILAVTLHEVAHGWVADRRGDPTARLMGRLSLNPLVHVDLFGTVILPLLLLFSQAGILFGYAKPVPVNFRNLQDPKRDMIWVAGAGPATNLLLALLSALLLQGLLSLYQGPFWNEFFFRPLSQMAFISVRLNVLLAIINLIPIPPADGGRILVGILPHRQARLVSSVEPVGMVLLMIVIFFDPFRVFSHGIVPVIDGLTTLLLGI
ncbi:MAG: site-2 protease family protein [Nitrospinota bacterium]|nr:MAG: site-2 protease family protein [Nitrospinota bacterium]